MPSAILANPPRGFLLTVVIEPGLASAKEAREPATRRARLSLRPGADSWFPVPADRTAGQDPACSLSDRPASRIREAKSVSFRDIGPRPTGSSPAPDPSTSCPCRIGPLDWGES